MGVQEEQYCNQLIVVQVFNILHAKQNSSSLNTKLRSLAPLQMKKIKIYNKPSQNSVLKNFKKVSNQKHPSINKNDTAFIRDQFPGRKKTNAPIVERRTTCNRA